MPAGTSSAKMVAALWQNASQGYTGAQMRPWRLILQPRFDLRCGRSGLWRLDSDDTGWYGLHNPRQQTHLCLAWNGWLSLQTRLSPIMCWLGAIVSLNPMIAVKPGNCVRILAS
jgi:hypothetical protein